MVRHDRTPTWAPDLQKYDHLDPENDIKNTCDALGFHPEVLSYFLFMNISENVIAGIAKEAPPESLTVVEVARILKKYTI